MTAMKSGYVIHMDDFSEDVDRPAGHKGAWKGTVEEILTHIRLRKRFSVFWATETQKRANNLTSLIKDGVVVCDNSTGYPWTAATIDESKLPHSTTPAPQGD